ncbi:MAG: hypothetical protein ABS86_02370 [Sphingobium sp. SCN 64-10]|nr:hypothetical protein [Sphingomonadales bacterium]ODT91586.1 MAG: hypothetical protein ABS86_02370 [Sphingobium sp. SCN 64-10]
MRRLGYLLLCLLTASLLTSATVHARESSFAPTIECSGVVHNDGDVDQSQGDADRGMPHHHGSCHSAPAFVPVASNDVVNLSADDDVSFRPVFVAPERWLVGPDLRPPIA